MERDKLPKHSNIMLDGCFDMTPLETFQFIEAIRKADPGWNIVAIRPSGINIEGPYVFSAACERHSKTHSSSYLFKVPENTEALFSLVKELYTPFVKEDLIFSFDVEGGEIKEVNFNNDGEVIAIIHPGRWEWRSKQPVSLVPPDESPIGGQHE